MEKGSGMGTTNRNSTALTAPTADGTTGHEYEPVQPIASTSTALLVEQQPIPSTSTSLDLQLQPQHSPPPTSAPSTPPSSVAQPRKTKYKKHATNTARDNNNKHRDEAVKTCEALDRTGKPCEEVVVGGQKGKVSRKWCPDHDKEQQGLRDEFHRCVLLVLPLPTLQPPLSSIAKETSPEKLTSWEDVTREKWELADKAIRTRRYHRKHYSSMPIPSDFTKDVLLALKSAREILETRLEAINTRSHSLILSSEDASWLLPTTCPFPSPSKLPAFHPPPPSSDLRPPTAPPMPTFDAEPDPVKARDSVRRSELLELISLTGSHASFIKDTRKSVERVRVVECLMRRIICRDRVLLVKAYRGARDHVLRFFEDPLCCTLPDLQRLWALLQETSVHQIKEAVMDAFRAMKWEESGAGETEAGDEGVGFQIIGGWVYKNNLPREMEWKEWEHVFDLLGCASCAVRICSTFTEWTRIRRLSVVPRGSLPPPYESWADPNETDAGRIFRAVDLVLCASEKAGDESEVRNLTGGFVGPGKGKGVWVERETRNWVVFKMSISHPKAASILSHLYSHHILLIRTSHTAQQLPQSSFPLPALSDVWLSRHRSSPARASLRHQVWSTPDSPPFPLIQEDNSPNASSAPVLATLFNHLYNTRSFESHPKFRDHHFEILVLDAHGPDLTSREHGSGGGGGPGSPPGVGGTGRSATTYVSRSFAKFEAELGDLVSEACWGPSSGGGIKGALEWGEAESYRRGDMLFDFKKDTGGKGLVKIAAPVENVGRGKEREKEKSTKAMLDSLRDDALAFRLSRSLFK
ncbi:hypothetical protein T439DRAFT_323838 [Meredithblackwellia eburnea MCA 4105]